MKKLNLILSLSMAGLISFSNPTTSFACAETPVEQTYLSVSSGADYVRKFNYGVTFGGGFEMEMSELSNVFVEASIQPDYSFQYEHFGIDNIRNPWVPNERIDLPPTQVSNLSIELKVGVKFLRKIEYID